MHAPVHRRKVGVTVPKTVSLTAWASRAICRFSSGVTRTLMPTSRSRFVSFACPRRNRFKACRCSFLLSVIILLCFLMWDVRNAGRNGGVIGAEQPQSSEKDAGKRDCLPYTMATPCGNTFPMLAKRPDSLSQRFRFAYCRGKNSKKAAHKRNTETMHMVWTSYVSGLCHKRENPQKNIWLNMFNPAGQS